MYSSYYSSKVNKNSSIKNKKATPQYLFLNMIKNFSILFLIMTIFYIPIYIGLAEANFIYWQSKQSKQFKFSHIILSGTIFSLKQYQTCINSNQSINLNQQITNGKKIKNNSSSVINNSMQSTLKQTYCFQNKLNFLPLIQDIQRLQQVYNIYFVVTLFLLFLGVIVSEYKNIILQLQLQYPTLAQQNPQKRQLLKLQRKKLYHLECDLDWPIYILKPKLFQQLNIFFQQKYQMIYSNCEFKIKNVKILLKEKFKKYAQIKSKIYKINSQLLIFNAFQLIKIVDDQIKTKQNIQRKKSQLQTLMLQKTHLQIQIQKSQNFKYNSQDFWVHVDDFKSCLMIQNFLQNSKKQQINIFVAEGLVIKPVKINKMEYSDIIVQNSDIVQGQQTLQKILKTNQNNSNSFSKSHKIRMSNKNISEQNQLIIHKNKNSILFIKFLRIVKFTLGILLCFLIIIGVDILIMIINKSTIFKYAGMFVVLILQILLKQLIIKFSRQFERHRLYSYQSLSTMIKLTLFLFFNLSFILVISHHNLGDWKLGKIISTYEYNEFNQKWYIEIGNTMIMVIIIQIIYCNLRVYIQTIKGILFGFLSRRVNNLIRFRSLKQKVQFWIQDYVQNYKKPIIDLQISYSHIIPIYLTGIIFSYMFPIMYPFLFVFSITLYHSQQNYIELYSEKVPYSSAILDKWAYNIVYTGFFITLLLYSYVKNQQLIKIIVYFSITMVMYIVKYIVINRNKILLKKLLELSENQPIYQNQTQDYYQSNSQRNFKTLPQISEEQHLSEIIQTNTYTQDQLRQTNKLEKNIYNQIVLKQYQLILLQSFYGKSRYINQVHSQYYQKYKKIIKTQMEFLKKIYK